MMKKFFVTICAAFMLLTASAQAQIPATVQNADAVADAAGERAEKFYVTLPKAKGDYKSSKRPILLEGAMNTETEILIRALKNPVAYRELNYLFVAGTMEDYPVVVVRTEQGLANSAASTALAIKKFNPVVVINQGTAGGHDPALKIGDIVIGSKAINNTAVKTVYSTGIADLIKQEMRGTYAYDAATKKFQPNTEYLPDPTLFNIAFAVANAHEEFNAISGVISSCDAWFQNTAYINFLHEKYGSSCEEMETAAVAQICKNADVPFIGIRVISDNGLAGLEYSAASADIAQKFVLLVVKDYVRAILNR